MTKRLSGIPLAMAVCLVAGTGTAHAGWVSFDFNSLGNGNGSTLIQSYMQGLLSGGATVTVSSGAVADNAYTGDGHVVGYGTAGTSNVQSVTLATSDGDYTDPLKRHLSSPDTFIKNTSSATGFTFSFTGLKITDISFDYEIFPDSTCTSLTDPTKCGGSTYPYRPDFTFSTNLGTVFHYYGNTPSGNWVESPCTSGIGGVSCTGTTEATPQLLGTTGTIALSGNVNTLNFLDWPATIGIDNLKINVTAVPEPGTMLLLGTGVATVIARRRRKQNT